MGRLLEAGLPRVRLVGLPPSSGLSLPGRACRLQAVPTGRRGNRVPPDRDDVEGGVATVPRRAEISALRGTVAAPCPGYGVMGCTVASSYLVFLTGRRL